MIMKLIGLDNDLADKIKKLADGDAELNFSSAVRMLCREALCQRWENDAIKKSKKKIIKEA